MRNPNSKTQKSNANQNSNNLTQERKKEVVSGKFDMNDPYDIFNNNNLSANNQSKKALEIGSSYGGKYQKIGITPPETILRNKGSNNDQNKFRPA